MEAAVDEMFDVAISLHGTLSGEHGIGTAKSKWMEKETSRGTILFSQRLRRALDTFFHILDPDSAAFCIFCFSNVSGLSGTFLLYIFFPVSI